MKKNTTNKAEDLLLEMIKDMPFLWTDHAIYASILRKSKTENVDVMGSDFRSYIKTTFKKRYKFFPSDVVLKNVIDFKLNEVKEDGVLEEAHRRLGAKKGIIYYDLGDGNFVKIDRTGWIITKKAPAFFLRNSDQLIQSTPISIHTNNKNLELLRNKINISDADWALFVPYLVSCYNPNIQHPILTINGSYGTGKSTLAKIVKYLVDPSQNELERADMSTEVMSMRLNCSYYLAFDNISSLSRSQSDYLCGVFSGISNSTRRIYTQDLISWRLRRPICLNGITDFVKRDDLLSRCLFLRTIQIKNRRTEREFWQEMEQDKPSILAEIFDLLSGALAIENNINLETETRIADFQKFGYAVAETIETGMGQVFLSRLRANKVWSLECIQENEILIPLINNYLDDIGNIDERTSTLYKHLRSYLLTDYEDYDDLNDDNRFPKDSARLGKRLRKIESPLNELNIFLKFYYDAQKYSCVKILKNDSLDDLDNGCNNITREPILGLRKPIIKKI